MLKFIQIADLHLDSPFSGCSMTERRARRDELKNALISAVSYCRENNIDMMLVCGDLFDGEFARRETVAFAAECFGRIPNVRVFIAPGNHDAYNAVSPYKYCTFPGNVHIFKSESLECVEIPELECAVYGFGYNSSKMREKPVSGIHPHNTDRLNILMAHGDIDSQGSPYYNISSYDLESSGLDYVALGHIHKPSGLMYFGKTPCAYSGCLVGRDFGECGKRGMIAGELSKGTADIRYIPVTHISYEEVIVDATEKSLSDIVEEFRKKCASFTEQTRVRAVLTGERDMLVEISEHLLSENLLHFDAFSFVDKTTEKIMYRELLEEYSLRGEYARMLRPYMEASEESIRQKGLLALRYGLDALKK